MESQTSYITRLAEAHLVSVGLLLSKVVSPSLDKNYLNQGSGFYKYATELNSLGKQAADFNNALSILTGINEMESLTLVAFQNMIPSRDLLYKTKRWCPKCFENWKTENKTLYEPLIWGIKPVNICSTHKTILQINCPNCNQTQPILTQSSRIGFCS